MAITAGCRGKIANARIRMDWKIIRSGRYRYRHRHADLDRKHGEGHDQAQRQRADRERSRDSVGQSGGGDRRRAAAKAPGARRPDHGLNPSLRGRITRAVWQFLQGSQAILGRYPPENGKMAAITAVMPAISALHSRKGPRPRRRCRPGRRRRRRAASPWRRNRASARPVATSGGSPGTSQGHSRSGRRHGCSRRARCRRR